MLSADPGRRDSVTVSGADGFVSSDLIVNAQHSCY